MIIQQPLSSFFYSIFDYFYNMLVFLLSNLRSHLKDKFIGRGSRFKFADMKKVCYSYEFRKFRGKPDIKQYILW